MRIIRHADVNTKYLNKSANELHQNTENDGDKHEESNV